MVSLRRERRATRRRSPTWRLSRAPLAAPRVCLGGSVGWSAGTPAHFRGVGVLRQLCAAGGAEREHLHQLGRIERAEEAAQLRAVRRYPRADDRTRADLRVVEPLALALRVRPCGVQLGDALGLLHSEVDPLLFSLAKCRQLSRRRTQPTEHAELIAQSRRLPPEERRDRLLARRARERRALRRPAARRRRRRRQARRQARRRPAPATGAAAGLSAAAGAAAEGSAAGGRKPTRRVIAAAESGERRGPPLRRTRPRLSVVFGLGAGGPPDAPPLQPAANRPAAAVAGGRPSAQRPARRPASAEERRPLAHALGLSAAWRADSTLRFDTSTMLLRVESKSKEGDGGRRAERPEIVELAHLNVWRTRWRWSGAPFRRRAAPARRRSWTRATASCRRPRRAAFFEACSAFFASPSTRSRATTRRATRGPSPRGRQLDRHRDEVREGCRASLSARRLRRGAGAATGAGVFAGSAALVACSAARSPTSPGRSGGVRRVGVAVANAVATQARSAPRHQGAPGLQLSRRSPAVGSPPPLEPPASRDTPSSSRTILSAMLVLASAAFHAVDARRAGRAGQGAHGVVSAPARGGARVRRRAGRARRAVLGRVPRICGRGGRRARADGDLGRSSSGAR